MVGVALAPELHRSGGTVSGGGADDDDVRSVLSADRHSVTSTVGTTTSLASRLRDLVTLVADEGVKEDIYGSGTPCVAGGMLLPSPLQLHMREPLQVCARLFERRSHPPLRLRRLSMAQVEDFRQHGYLIVDGLLSREAAARVKAEALQHGVRGALQPVPAAAMGFASLAALGSLSPRGGWSSSGSGSLLQPQAATLQQRQGGRPHSHSGGRGPAAGGQQQRGHAASAMQQQQQQQQRCGELRMSLQLGQPPADTAALAPVMAALQELQDDLSEFVRLRGRGGAEYALCSLPSGAAVVPRHRDALPDDGRVHSSYAAAVAAVSTPVAPTAGPQHPSQQQQQLQQQQQQQQPRRISVFAFVNHDWDRDTGGGLRLWPPQRPLGGPPSTAATAASARRSPTSSDAGTTYSEISDCSSLRAPVLGSTTSSVVAETSAPDHDAYSLDGLSVADSEVERQERAQGFEWLETDAGDMALDIAPVAGRAVLLLSGAVEHALLPPAPGGPDVMFLRAWLS